MCEGRKLFITLKFILCSSNLTEELKQTHKRIKTPTSWKIWQTIVKFVPFRELQLFKFTLTWNKILRSWDSQVVLAHWCPTNVFHPVIIVVAYKLPNKTVTTNTNGFCFLLEIIQYYLQMTCITGCIIYSSIVSMLDGFFILTLYWGHEIAWCILVLIKVTWLGSAIGLFRAIVSMPHFHQFWGLVCWG